MATLRNTFTDEIIVLKTQHSFGRDNNNNTCLPLQDISRSHSMIYWNEGYWYLKDYSTNGTLVNGECINHTTVKVPDNSEVQFSIKEQGKWILENTSAPSSYLQSTADNKKFLELKTCHGLPNDATPNIVFYYNQNRQWVAEKGSDILVLKHGERYFFEGEYWIFNENESQEKTLYFSFNTSHIYLQFNLSIDEENINLKIISKDQEFDLGSRAYNYLLLTLCRKCLADEELGHAESDKGWLDMEDLILDMSREQGKELDPYYINLQIFRLRKQLMDIEPYGYLFSNIIERRRGELRFAYDYFQLVKDGECIGQILATPQ